ncbi:MAG: hypothetical protein IKI01_08295 [Lachnospiraceae bacterium]|nr:hypothetical protein [Lachnospiraceae bacterium]
MKKTVGILCVLLVMLVLPGCCISHRWVDATCEEAKHCSKCGKTEGGALGHRWVDATCEEAKHCSVCGKTEGTALGHTWQNRTTTAPQTCSTCGATAGEKITCTEIDLEWLKEAGCDPGYFVSFFENTLISANRKELLFVIYDYNHREVNRIEVFPEGVERIGFFTLSPGDLANSELALFALRYYADGKCQIRLYDRRGNIIGELTPDMDFSDGRALDFRFMRERRYLMLCYADTDRYGDEVLAIDAETLTLPDLNDVPEPDKLFHEKIQGVKYKEAYVQPTIDNRYTLVEYANGSGWGYIDQYDNEVAIYRHATGFSYHGYALVSDDGKTYDLVDDHLNVVGTNVVSGHDADEKGYGVFLVYDEDDTPHYYMIK